jgi:hypothetical protein
LWRISWKAGLQNDGRTLRLEINNESLKYEKGEGGEVTKNETKRNEVKRGGTLFPKNFMHPQLDEKSPRCGTCGYSKQISIDSKSNSICRYIYISIGNRTTLYVNKYN